MHSYLESTVFIFSYNYELETYLHQCQWDSALELVHTVTAGLQRYRHQVGEEFRLTCYFRFAVAYLFAGQPHMALDYLQKVLEEFGSDTRADVQRVARLVQLLAHYELGNLQLLAHLVRTCRYALKKQKAVYEAEKLILSYFQRLSRLRRHDAARRLLERLRADLLEIFAASDYEKRLQDVFNFSHWLALKCAENA